MFCAVAIAKLVGNRRDVLISFWSWCILDHRSQHGYQGSAPITAQTIVGLSDKGTEQFPVWFSCGFLVGWGSSS